MQNTDIDIAESVESILIWDCTTSGYYYFKVNGYDEEDDEGHYSISVSLTNLESPLSKLSKKSIGFKRDKKNHFIIK